MSTKVGSCIMRIE